MTLDACLKFLTLTYETHPPTERKAPTSVAFLDWAVHNLTAFMPEKLIDKIDVSSLEEQVGLSFWSWDKDAWSFFSQSNGLDRLELATLKFAHTLWHFCSPRQERLTPLAICCYFEWPSIARLFLKHIPMNATELNGRGAWGETVLHLAIGRKNIELINLLLAHPHIAVNEPFLYNRKPIHMAIAMTIPEAAESLVKCKGLEINSVDVLGWTAFRLLCETYTGHISAGKDVSPKLMDILLRHESTDINSLGTDGSTTISPLQRAIAKYNAQPCRCLALGLPARQECSRCALLQFLLQHPSLVIEPSAVHRTIANGDHVLLKRLLAHKSLSANMHVLPGLPAATMAIHMMYFGPSGTLSRTLQMSNRQHLEFEVTSTAKIMEVFLSCHEFDINCTDMCNCTILDWLDFYKGLRGSDDAAGVDIRWVSGNISDRDIAEFRRRVGEADLGHLRVLLSDAGALPKGLVTRERFEELSISLMQAAGPDRADALAASLFPSLAVERGSAFGTGLSAAEFDSLVGTKPGSRNEAAFLPMRSVEAEWDSRRLHKEEEVENARRERSRRLRLATLLPGNHSTNDLWGSGTESEANFLFALNRPTMSPPEKG